MEEILVIHSDLTRRLPSGLEIIGEQPSFIARTAPFYSRVVTICREECVVEGYVKSEKMIGNGVPRLPHKLDICRRILCVLEYG